MILLAAPGALGAAIYNFLSSNSEPGAGIWWLVFAGVATAMYFLALSTSRRSRQFLMWLLTNRDAIRAEGAEWQGIRITGNTFVAEYEAAISVIFMSFKISSGYQVSDRGKKIAGAVYTLISLVFGWWGIPWGPVFTVQTLARNFNGGDPRLVERVIQEIERQLPGATPA